MEALNELLARLPDGALGTVVVVGAGRNEAARALSHRANAVVLVEGDPDAIAELQAQTASSGPQVRVVGVPVSAEGGVLSWNRYNLRWLNGPLDASGLVRWYPRLQTLGALPLRAKALRELLAEVDLIADARVPNVLVLDVPGQEGPLLEAVDPAVLEAFDWIVVTSCAQPPDAGWCAPSRSGERLRRVGFELTDPEGDEHAQWPRRLYRLDRVALEHRRTVAALRVASERVLELEAETAGLRSRRGELEQDLTAREAALALAQKLAADRGGQLQATQRSLKDIETASRQQAAASADRIAALEAAAAEAVTQAREQQQRQEAVRAEWVDRSEALSRTLGEREAALAERDAVLAERDAALAERDAALAQAQSREDRQAQEITALQDRIAALSRTLAERDAALAERDAALTQARSRLAEAEAGVAAAQKMAADRGGQLLKLEADLQQRQKAAESDKAEAAKRIAAIEAERDQQARILADLQRAAAEASAARDALAAELKSSQSRLQALEGELSRAADDNTGRSERIAALERELQGASAQLATRQAELAAALKEAEGLRAEGAKVLERHEQALAAARKEAQAAQQAAKAEVERFKDEMEQLRLRQRLLGEEMIRAEGQIDLIKDVLLRETGL